MRVLVAGASGAIGSRLIPQLVERGHEVVGSSRSPEKSDRLAALGAEPIVLDLLDPGAVRRAVTAARPDAIVHQATALRDLSDLKNPDKSFAETNRLRTEGTDALLAAGREVDVKRFLAQSFTSWPYAREGGPVKTEEDPLDPEPVPTMRKTLDAIRHLEQAVVAAGGIALRYGGFYGSPDDAQLELVRKRRFPIVGDGGGIWSFVHLDDAASATVLALEERRARDLQRRRRRARAGLRVAACAGRRDRREAAAPRSTLARADRGGRGRRRPDDRDPRRLEREGEARARLDAPLPELAAGVPCRLQPGRRLVVELRQPHLVARRVAEADVDAVRLLLRLPVELDAARLELSRSSPARRPSRRRGRPRLPSPAPLSPSPGCRRRRRAGRERSAERSRRPDRAIRP